MNQALRRVRPDDFEEFGYQTRLACGNIPAAMQICGLHLYACSDELQSELSRLNSDTLARRQQAAALHAHLYDRPIPVSDAAMLTHAFACRIQLTLTLAVSVACLVGNTATFVLLGYDILVSLVGAVGITALPLVVGHLAYERIMAGHRRLQILVIAVVTLLCFGALIKLGEARRDMVDKATAISATASYVDDPSAGPPQEPEPKSKEDSESRIHQTMGEAILWFMIAADIALGLLVGLLVRKHSDEDYAAWRKLKKLNRLVIDVEKCVADLHSSIEIAKKRCMAGILRAENTLTKRRPPYHRALGMVLVVVILSARASLAQKTERYEGILVDTSTSISRVGTLDDLFHEYLIATRTLLLTEPPNTRVWVSSISADSFGGTHEILKGWTPDSRGVFTDDLNRARHELASNFEAKSAEMAPVARGTDIFGGLWRLKASFESRGDSSASDEVVWIFSDMVNETLEFSITRLLDADPGLMVDQVKAKGLLVPLNGYEIHVRGASTQGLTPQAWARIRTFWTKYFEASGAHLVSYSTECNMQR